MSRFVAFITILGLAVLTACDNPPPTEPPTGLEGEYVGTYSWTFDPGGGPETTLQAVIFGFGQSTFYMNTDTSSALYDSTVCFCKAYGSYALSDKVTLVNSAIPPQSDNCPTCDPDQSPNGVFVLEHPAGGLKLTRIDTTGPEPITSQLILEQVSPY